MKKTSIYAMILCILASGMMGCDTGAASTDINDVEQEGRWQDAHFKERENYSDIFNTRFKSDKPYSAEEYAGYARALAESESAPEDYAQAVIQYGDPVCYPVYGTCLEYTDLFVTAFFEDNKAKSAFTLYITNESDIGVCDFNSFEVQESMNYSNQVVFTRIQDDLVRVFNMLAEKDFEIMGMVYTEKAYVVPFIGKESGSDYLRYYYPLDGAEFRSFFYVGDIQSVEEGQQAYVEYLDKQAEVYAKVPTFGELRSVSTFEQYTNWGDPYRYDYDYVIEVSLLDADLEVSEYSDALLFKDNQFIGEVIMTRGEDNEPVVAKDVTIAEKDENGKYIPMQLEDSIYMQGLYAAAKNTNMTVIGMIYDGKNIIPCGHANGKEDVVVYSMEEKKLLSADTLR